MGRTLRNIGWTAVGTGLETGLAFVIGIAAARYMGVEAFGGLAVATALAAITKKMIVGGVGSIMIKKGAEGTTPENWEAAGAAVIKERTRIWVAMAAAGCLLLPTEIGLALALMCIALVASPCDARNWMLQGQLQWKKTLLPDRAGQAAGGIARIAMIAGTLPGWAFAGASAVTEWTRWWLLKQGAPKLPEPELEKIAEVRAGGKQLLPGAMARLALTTGPMLALGWVSGEAAGNLAAAAKLIWIAGLPAIMIGQSINPTIMAGGSWKRKSAGMGLIGAGMGMGICLYGLPLITALYGEGFWPGGRAAEVLGLTLFPLALLPALEARLLWIKKERWISVGALAGLATAVIVAAMTAQLGGSPLECAAWALAIQGWVNLVLAAGAIVLEGQENGKGKTGG